MTKRIVHLTGGPLDGLTMDATDWTDEEVAGGTYHVVHGWEERADYATEPGGDPFVWHYRGPVVV
ncbi:hypothetical protein [Streptomyces sp. MP131-18]|uniref:hypothetical protein n=1 Tax=Streptomyces sp. MP131-18 TaxID=1857892 RepID=UPI00097C0856|nr:hypothetical protein [Streptomyces sp. MP131-18]ONK09415.1 hypothetical protein STBA_01150 [Streptomyces sp. MP131-18]